MEKEDCKMKAAVLYEPKKLIVEEVELEGPRFGEVLVKLTASGVCHSDLSRVTGSRPLPMPIVLGHEGAGVVQEVGEGVRTLKPGDHVILSWIAPCGKCLYCVSGRPNLCVTAVANGAKGVMPDGTTRLRKGDLEIHHMYGASTFGEFSVVAESGAIKIPDSVNLKSAAIIGCAVVTGVGSVINTAKVVPGSATAVFGAGGVGLNVIQGCALVNASDIIAVDIVPEKLESAKKFGATHTINANEVDVLEALKDFTGGDGVDYAFDAVGSPPTALQAFEATRKAGTVVIIGMFPPGVQVSVPGVSIPFGEKILTGSFYGSCVMSRDFPKMARLYEDGKIKLDEMITHRFPIEEINEAFEVLESGKALRPLIDYK
jgi:S-(hydroxymethyl)glutathione dehydrogenase/alcohol dehydrogenase